MRTYDVRFSPRLVLARCDAANMSPAVSKRLWTTWVLATASTEETVPAKGAGCAGYSFLYSKRWAGMTSCLAGAMLHIPISPLSA